MPLEHGQDCEQCGHPFDPHVMIPTRERPEQGGIGLCPHKGCECLTTWSYRDKSSADDVVVPTEWEIARLREIFQKGD